MGQVVKQDRAMSLDLMHTLMEMLELQWEMSEDARGQNLIASIGAYSIIVFCGSFKEPEVFKVDLFGLTKYVEENPR